MYTAGIAAAVGLLAIVPACSRAGGDGRAGRPAVTEQSLARTSDKDSRESLSNLAASLRRVQRLGDFDALTTAAQAAAKSGKISDDAQLLVIEGLLAASDLPAAEQMSRQLLRPANSEDLATPILKLWSIARLRQGKPLVEADREQELPRAAGDASDAGSVLFWQQELGRADPYRIPDENQSAQLPLKRVRRSGPEGDFVVEGIAAEFNGATAPLVFIDTGAQYTIISTKLAREAGVKIGPATTELVGFARSVARPAVVRELRIGSLTVENVPVYVADSAPLESAGGQAAIGTDLMYHVRLSIDYPHSRVTAKPARDMLDQRSIQASWKVPVWAFAHVPLAQATTRDGRYARVLIDTGNRTGAYVSGRWQSRISGRDRLEGSPTSGLFKRKPTELPELSLAGHQLTDWPVTGLLPGALERADLVDVLIGHDLISEYLLTIDLRGGALYLTPH